MIDPNNDHSPGALADGLETQAGAMTAGLTQELHDAPTAARATWGQFSDTVIQIGSVASQAATAAEAMRADASLVERRGGGEQARVLRAQADEFVAKAQQDVAALAAQGVSLVDITAAQIRGSLVAPVASDSARLLARQEITQKLGDARGVSAASTLINLMATADPAVVSECFSSWGLAFMEPGPGDRSDPSRDGQVVFRRDGISRLMSRPENARRQAQLAQVNGPAGKGSVAAARTAARLRLGGK